MRPTLLTAVLAALSMLAAAACLYALIATQRYEYALTGAVLLLALAQITGYLARGDQRSNRDRIDLVRAVSELGHELDGMKQRVATLEERLADADTLGEAATRMQDEVRTLQQTVARFTRASQGRAGKGRRSEPATDARREPRAPALAEGSDEPDLMLEPIVRLDNGVTDCYRAALDGDDGASEDPAQDLAVMRQVLPVIRKLKAKGRGTAVMCRVSGAALNDEGFVRRLIDLLSTEPDTLTSLILDIDQRTLAALSPKGLEGLAWIGEHGAQFCLSGADTASPDVPALARLRFSFIDVSAERIADAAGITSVAARYAATQLFRSAARHGVGVIASGVESDETLAAVAPYVSLGRGGLFSPPRRVRPEAARVDRPANVA